MTDDRQQRWLPPVATADAPSYREDDAVPAPGTPGPASPDPFGARRESRLKRLFGPVALAIFAILKWGKALLLLLPKIKVLTTAGSALVSVAAYAVLWGWRFAVIFVALLFVHEMGHVIQLRREGVKASAPMFIPFLGALVMMKEMPKDAAAEGRVGLAGPVLGSLGALALLPIHWATGSDLWLNLAYVGFFLNLFNLIPVSPLDGGRAMAALAPWMWFVGLFAVALLAFATANPFIFLVLIIGGLDVYRRWKGRHEHRDYYRVRPRTRGLVALTYLLLLVGLAVGMDATYQEREL